MPDICMCNSRECHRAEECRRHPDSGTVPGERQSWGAFDTIRYWSADDCSGFLPKFNKDRDAGVHGGRGLL